MRTGECCATADRIDFMCTADAFGKIEHVLRAGETVLRSRTRKCLIRENRATFDIPDRLERDGNVPAYNQASQL